MDHQTTGRRRWAWWHRQTPTTRRVLRTAVLLLVTGALALAVGVSTASARSSLGPHEAVYSVTLDRQATVELGPLGAVVAESPLPWPLGVEVVVREIPLDLESAGSPATGLLADLQAYAQLFGHPEAAVADAVRAVVADALGRTAVLWSAMLVLIAAARLASRGLLREHVKDALARPGVAVLGGAATLALVGAALVPAVQQRPPAGLSPPVLDGTPLEGVLITGRLADLVATYGHVLRDAYEENEAFYALARANLGAAVLADDQSAPVPPPVLAVEEAVAASVEDAAGLTETEGVLAPPEGVTPPEGVATAEPSPTDSPPADDDGADGAAADGQGAVDGETTPSDGSSALGADGAPPADAAPVDAAPAEDATGEAAEPPDPATFLFVSDVHCNVGMTTVIGAAASIFGVDAVLDGGDTVMSGSSVESYCINAYAAEVPGDVPVVVATGNHDSVTTAQQERDAGWTVLGGDVVEVAGVRILGDTDPTLTAIGAGTRQERDETIPEMEQRLAETACAVRDSDPVDLLLVHNPRAGGATLEQGCAPLQLSGHWHRTVGPEPAGAGLRYVSTSSGGGAGGGATVGPLTGEAEMTLVRVDRNTGRPMDYRRVYVGTDASVRLGTWFTFPEPAPPPPGDLSAPATDATPLPAEPTDAPGGAAAGAG